MHNGSSEGQKSSVFPAFHTGSVNSHLPAEPIWDQTTRNLNFFQGSDPSQIQDVHSKPGTSDVLKGTAMPTRLDSDDIIGIAQGVQSQ